MGRKSNVLPKLIQTGAYLLCLHIITLNITHSSSEEYTLLNPIIEIEHVLMRAFLICIALTFCGFFMIKYAVSCSTIKLGITDKYIAGTLFFIGISRLFFPIKLEVTASVFISSLLFSISYLASKKILKNNEHNKFLDKMR